LDIIYEKIDPNRGKIDPNRGKIDPNRGKIDPNRGKIDPNRGKIDPNIEKKKERMKKAIILLMMDDAMLHTWLIALGQHSCYSSRLSSICFFCKYSFDFYFKKYSISLE
jgi:hypothetical protein